MRPEAVELEPAGPRPAEPEPADPEPAEPEPADPGPRKHGGARLANDAWEALLGAHAVLMKEFAAEDIWADLSMREYDVLYTLSKCPAPIRLGELHRHVLLSQPALSRLADRLVARGLVERAVDPSDGRGVLLSLTADGRERQRAVGRKHARSVATALTRALTTDQLGRLEDLCRRLASGATTPGGQAPTRGPTRTPRGGPTKDLTEDLEEDLEEAEER